eukprot:scaffold8030_cov62-Attheya_sp.AAC.2
MHSLLLLDNNGSGKSTTAIRATRPSTSSLRLEAGFGVMTLLVVTLGASASSMRLLVLFFDSQLIRPAVPVGYSVLTWRRFI